ncbi:MAG: hypothetical protein JWN45_1707 [Acidobacteriaceae bacterium]|nr:hypothetical protein [Acidobacteriaceae bacterium]
MVQAFNSSDAYALDDAALHLEWRMPWVTQAFDSGGAGLQACTNCLLIVGGFSP